MASVSGLSSTSSIYGSRNVISGLASGMDTESMIENAVSGYKAKITSLNQKRTKVEWQQDAYRSIIDKMVAFNQKYTSYNSSSTNLLSAAFFNNAVNISTSGANASKVAATGRTTSDISILGVKQLASAARYSISADRLTGKTNVITADKALNLGDSKDISTIDGSMTIKYGKNNLTLNFGTDEIFADGEALANAIDEKLGELEITRDSGTTVKANEMVKVSFENGEIVIKEKDNGPGNAVAIESLSGNLKKVLGGGLAEDKKSLAIGADIALQKTVSNYDRLSGKSMSFTLDGVTKTISLGTVDENTTPDALKETIQTELNKAFAGEKVKVELDNGKLQFTVAEHSSLKITSSVNGILGLDAGGATSYMNTGKTLESLGVLNGLDAVKFEGDKSGGIKEEGEGDATRYFYEDANGKKIYTDATGEYLVDNKGEKLYSFNLNGVEIGQYSKNTTLETILSDINKNTEAGVTASYSKTTNAFTFTAKETGAGREVTMGEGLAQSLFGYDKNDPLYENRDGNIYQNMKKADGTDDWVKIGSTASGKDAEFTAEINGDQIVMTRSTNVVELDGLNVTLKGAFGYDAAGNLDTQNTEAVAFTSATDTEKIIDVVKSMVEDYNALMKEVKDAYSTLPAKKANKTGYEPLTEEDKADMSESAVKAYEEKAKQGILFADKDLSALYNSLRSAITRGGEDGAILRSIGIGSNFSDGQTTLTLDENKLRAALESNPDQVKDAFVKTAGNGSSTDGFMQTMKNTLERYAKTTGATKGILIEKAGSPLSSASLLKNIFQDQLDNLDAQIDKWTTKMSDQVDRYTTQFSRLEQLIAQMNSQSSMLSGLMGG